MNASTSAIWFIRRARPQDREPVAQLLARLNRPARSDSVIKEYFVAYSGDQIIGCAAVRCRKKIGYLYGLAVEKSWRKRGIGHALTEVRLNRLRTKRSEAAYVLSMFWNLRFFRKHGFVVTDRRNKGSLEWLHSDFSDAWSKRSALLALVPLNRLVI